jgi:hypothetical protein
MIYAIPFLTELANVQRVSFFFRISIVIKLIYGMRVYPSASLSAVISGLPPTYHHYSSFFFPAMMNHTYEGFPYLSLYLLRSLIRSLPQNNTNYIREPSWDMITLGIDRSHHQERNLCRYSSLNSM